MDLTYVFEKFRNLPEKFLNLPEPLSHKTLPKEWDNRYFDRDRGNKVYSIMDMMDDDVVTLWTGIEKGMKNDGICPKLMLDIVRVGFQLTDSRGSKVFQKVFNPDKILVEEDQGLSSTPFYHGEAQTSLSVTAKNYDLTKFEGVMDPRTIAKEASYICSTLIRLMKKSPDSYVKSLQNIKDRYMSFYRGRTHSTIVKKFWMNIRTAQVIHSGFESNDILVRTVVYYLTEGVKTLAKGGEALGLVRYLYMQHLELMGLHVYKLFRDVYKELEDTFSLEMFIDWLTNDSTVKALSVIQDVREKYDNEKNENDYLWMYARYLDTGYFYDIHTSKCRFLAYVLAYIFKELKKYQGNDPMKIEELKKMTTLERKEALGFATVFVEEMNKLRTDPPKSNVRKRVVSLEDMNEKPTATLLINLSPTTSQKDSIDDSADGMTTTRVAQPSEKKARII